MDTPVGEVSVIEYIFFKQIKLIIETWDIKLLKVKNLRNSAHYDLLI